MDTKPTSVRQLVDKTARESEESSFKQVVRFSENNALTPAAVAEAGAGAKNTQVVINLNTAAHYQSGRLGGNKNITTNANDAASPNIKVGIIGGKSEWDNLLSDMFHAGAFESLRGLFEQHKEPVQPSTKLTFISSSKEADEHYAAEKKPRERAPKGQTMEQVLTNLGSAVTTLTRPFRPMN